MVGHQVLVLSIEVRILVPEHRKFSPKFGAKLYEFVGCGENLSP